MSSFDPYTDPFTYVEGDAPILVSMPHSGLELTPEVHQGLHGYAKLLPDTDWLIPQLYDFLDGLNVSVIKANYSRYVIDLNRPLDDEKLYATKTTGLFPDITFDDRPLFVEPPVQGHREWCKQKIWQPYHDKILETLQAIKKKHGFAILFDAHSIAANVPMLFEGELPDFNWGTNGGETLENNLLEALEGCVNASSYSQVSNGRFKGGYITRHYGSIDKDIYAVQLELSQATYLQDDCYQLHVDRANNVRPIIEQCLKTLIEKK